MAWLAKRLRQWPRSASGRILAVLALALAFELLLAQRVSGAIWLALLRVERRGRVYHGLAG
ncbi:hypothetical protein [Marinobacterium aestuariivivens]|uniref:Thiol reductant ABC exporter subunit CydD n=1 Tax=Marinobacterium aestuariivivens TaxID=1698799 RepID=A0ABW2A8W9_9GAMM